MKTIRRQIQYKRPSHKLVNVNLTVLRIVVASTLISLVGKYSAITKIEDLITTTMHNSRELPSPVK